VSDQVEHVLSQTQRDYLKTLKQSPVWLSILDTIGRHGALPSYTPGGSDSHQQFYRWVFQSGVLHDREQMLLLLSNGRRVPPPLDTGD